MLNRLNAYRVMWIFVSFDLPTETKTQRKAASGFRKDLLSDGFVLFQYSVYVRQCASFDHAQTHIRRIQKLIPSEGKVAILSITDKQFGDMKIFYGKEKKKIEPEYVQLELF